MLRLVGINYFSRPGILIVAEQGCPSPKSIWATLPTGVTRHTDRLFWIWLSRFWNGWRNTLLIVKPQTVISWHRRGFRYYWIKISQRKGAGRPEASPKVRALVRQLAAAHPLWGAPRIHGELLKLGIDISERSVSRLMPRQRTPPSQSWRTFLNNHSKELVAIDFFTVPRATFRVLFVLVI